MLPCPALALLDKAADILAVNRQMPSQPTPDVHQFLCSVHRAARVEDFLPQLLHATISLMTAKLRFIAWKRNFQLAQPKTGERARSLLWHG
jgi:hypothetical protein